MGKELWDNGNMKKVLYLMRHGETLFNVQRKIQGWCDSPLTENGKKQALNIKKQLEEKMISFDHVYTSTSERCCDTVELITNQSYTRLKGIKEVNHGTLEGESEDLNPDSLEEYETFFVQYGGESVSEVRHRMNENLTAIMEKEDHEHVLVVSHAGACMNFLMSQKIDLFKMKKPFKNCTVVVLEYEDHQFQLVNVLVPQI